jgi:hypothetical protein
MPSTTTKKSQPHRFFAWPGFAHKVPIMVEQPGLDYIGYGVENEYPYYLLNMYRRSSKHNAIVNGKVGYIIGGGWQGDEQGTLETRAKQEKFISDANEVDDLNDLTQKLCLDFELFNGMAIAVTWSRSGQIARMEHVAFERVRVDKKEKMFQIANWYNEEMIRQFPKVEDIERIPAFDPENRIGKQLFYYRCYSAGVKYYPLPEYLGGLAWIEADVEIANFHNNNLRNNFWGGYLINFNNGIPTPEEQVDIERQIKRKFSGTDNAGRFVVTFNDDATKAPTMLPLTPSDMDKQFEVLNKTVQQEIFISHRVTNPQLFGVRVEGQLGGRKELVEAFELFRNTYVQDRIKRIERTINYLASFNGVEGLTLIPVEPITEQLSEQALMSIMTPDELREKAGLEPLKTAGEVIEPGEGDLAIEATAEPINEAIRTLSGRQYQNLMRIVRHYGQGKINLDQARTMLGAGFGLSAEQVDAFLGVNEQEFSAEDYEDATCDWGNEEYEILHRVASTFGSQESDYVILHSQPLHFTGKLEEDISNATKQAFAALDEEEKELDDKIIKYRRRNLDATVEEMAREFGVSRERIRKRVAYLMQKNRYPIRRVIDTIQKETAPTEVPTLEMRYRYAWAPGFSNRDVKTSREFCTIMMQMAQSGKVYTRDEINQISQIMGYSVWARRGGWYRRPGPADIRTPQCRHIWEQVTVIRRGNRITEAP